MSIFIVASVLPAWCENFYLLLFFRALSGVGCGMVLPLQATFLAAYPEKERATLMGLSATVGCIVAAAIVSVSGIIAEFNWRYVFFLYLVNVVALVLAVIFIPKNIEMPAEEAQESTSVANAPSLASYGKVLFLYYFLLTGSYLFVSVLSAELAPYLENVKMGGSAESGLLMSVSMLGSVVAGLILEKYTSILKGMAMPMVFAGSAIGFALLWLAPNIIVVGIAVFVVGIFASLVACVVNYELSRELPLALFTTASAGTNFFIFVLQFLAPMVCLALLGMVPGESFRIVFMVYTIIQIAMLALALILPKVLLKKNTL